MLLALRRAHSRTDSTPDSSGVPDELSGGEGRVRFFISVEVYGFLGGFFFFVGIVWFFFAGVAEKRRGRSRSG